MQNDPKLPNEWGGKKGENAFRIPDESFLSCLDEKTCNKEMMILLERLLLRHHEETLFALSFHHVCHLKINFFFAYRRKGLGLTSGNFLLFFLILMLHHLFNEAECI